MRRNVLQGTVEVAPPSETDPALRLTQYDSVASAPLLDVQLANGTIIPVVNADGTVVGGGGGGGGAPSGPAGGVLGGTYPDPSFSDADITAIAALNSATSGAIASDGAGWIKKTYAQFKTALGLVKGDVGLGNVDNTTDASKPVSTAQQAAIDAKVTANAGITGATKTKVTYDAKGLVTAGADVTSSDVGLGNVTNDAQLKASQLDTDSTLAANSDTKVPSQKAIKTYVDAVAQGLSPKQSVQEATAAALPTNTYLAGVITITATGVLTVDGQAVALNDRVLVQNETPAANNGIYLCTTAGAVGVAAVLTRATDSNTGAKILGGFVFVETGTVNADSGFVNTNTTAPTIGTTAIAYTQFSGAGEITAGAGLSKSGNTLSAIDAGLVIDAATSKATPVDADEFPIADSAASFILKKLTGTNLKAYLKTYFDTLYAATGSSVTSVFTRTGAVVAASGDYLASQVTNAADKIATSIQSFAAGIVSTHPTQGNGYATGAGGAVTQATNRSTGVTINKVTGQITTFNSSIVAGVTQVFTVNNSTVAIGDTITVNCQNDSTAGSPLQPPYAAKIQNGSFVLVYANNNTSSVTTAFVFNFTVTKGAAS